jgi:hypothetical protein
MKRWKKYRVDAAPADKPVLAWLHAPENDQEILIAVIKFNVELGRWDYYPQGDSLRRWIIHKWCEIEIPLEKGEPDSPEEIGIVDYLDKKIP